MALLPSSVTTFAQATGSHNQPPSRPFVFAHYMHCFVLGGINKNDDRVTDPDELTDTKDWPPIGEESEFFGPRLARFAASGAAANQEEFDLAEKVNVDAFGLLLYPEVLHDQFAAAITMAVTNASHSAVKILPEMWGNIWTDDYKTFGVAVKAFFDAHPGSQAYRHDKPMFLFAIPYPNRRLVAADTSMLQGKIDDFLKPWGGESRAYVIVYVSYDVATSIQYPFIRYADAVGIWTPEDDFSALHSQAAAEVALDLHKDLAWPVAPAFYQRRAGGFPMEYGNSFGAARYIDAWLAAVRMRPAFVDIQTWNDFSEDTAIVPSNRAGRTWLDLTAYFSSWAKTQRPPVVKSDTVMLFHPLQLAGATLSQPRALTTNYDWRHKSPTVDYLDCVTILRKPATVALRLGGQIWRQHVPAGLHDWVVYSPHSPPRQQGVREVKEWAALYPQDSQYRSITVVSALSAGTPTVELSRQGRVLTKLRSRAAYGASGRFQDLVVVGDEVKVNH